MNDFVIRTEGLTKRYGKIGAVDGLSMEVLRGHVYGLLGPNGSGKTTTMGMLLGLVRPTSGTFSLFGSTGRHGIRGVNGLLRGVARAGRSQGQGGGEPAARFTGTPRGL